MPIASVATELDAGCSLKDEVLLGDTKRGQEQTVLIQECSIVAWLDGFLARHRLRNADYLVPVGYTTFARWLTKACEGLGMSHVHWTTHSLRRGGATALMRAAAAAPRVVASSKCGM